MAAEINKAPELLLAGEILQLFESDVLVPSKQKFTPYPLLEQILCAYCEFLGVRTPSAKQLGAFLSQRFPKQLESNTTLYQVGINPAVIPSREPK